MTDDHQLIHIPAGCLAWSHLHGYMLDLNSDEVRALLLASPRWEQANPSTVVNRPVTVPAEAEILEPLSRIGQEIRSVTASVRGGKTTIDIKVGRRK